MNDSSIQNTMADAANLEANLPAVSNLTRSWTDLSDRLIAGLKWPMAILAALLILPISWALLRVLSNMLTAPNTSLIPFAAGIIVFAVLWRRWLGRSRWGIFMIKLEHELTHALFALLTGHAIVGFRAALGEGSEVRFAGKGNWLITSAPYFFPTATLVLFLLAFFLPFSALPWQNFLVGIALAYHIVSTWRETHRDQSDLHDLGKIFCWMFLPAANIAVVGLLIAYSHLGSTGASNWLVWLMEPWYYLRSLV
jgi:hypothetical protein